MKVIRIEHEDGWGMFIDISEERPSRKHSARYICPSIVDRHQLFPLPQRENLPISDEYFCAYKSVDQLKEWITTEEIATLKENNYRIFMLDVTNYHEGKYQVIYTKESIVNTTDITDLF